MSERSERPAMVILSGGQDSTTALYWAKREFRAVRAVTFDYGQRHQMEIAAASKIASMAGVPHEVCGVPLVLKSVSPLLSQTTLETYTDYAAMDRIIGNRVELTFVPLRNLLFLVIAANHAIAHGISDLVIGVCQADNANYPDCRETFINAARGAMKLALGYDREDSTGRLAIHTPLMDNSKAETVHLAASLPGCMEAMAYSHTCYAGRFPPCGVCHACVLRAHGFAEAGVDDPLVVRGREFITAA
jgi:7-cyano-7-deazaguanine synthase